MESQPEDTEFPITLRVPKNAFVLVAPTPATVTQRTVEQHFGVPPTAYKRMVRDGLFPAKRVGRLIFASYEDIRRAVTEGAVARTRIEKALERVAEQPPAASTASEGEVRRYLCSARTPAELRQRKKEVQAKGRELDLKYAERLPNGKRNPQFNRTLSNVASFMTIYGAVARWPMPPYVGPKGPCSSCSRPAYATRQAWDRGRWQGRPVCENCAQNLAPNERIMQYPEEKVLVPPRDPTVPTSDSGNKRRRR